MFEIELCWGSVTGEINLPYLVSVGALPTIGMVIEFKAVERGPLLRTEITYPRVQVEDIHLDARDPEDAVYVVDVIPK